MNKAKLIKLLQSGKFTIIYWDNQSPSIYKGHWDKDKEFEKDDYKRMNKSEIQFDSYGMNGYLPDIVDLLVEALGGKADSI